MWNSKETQQKKTKFFSAEFSSHRGFSFVELIITIAIFSLVFGGLIGAFQLMTQLIGASKAKAGALSMMSSKMEYIRSLPYNSIGTDGGVPSGLIPQHSTTTLNGITYTERVLVHYIDDPADGIGGADTNAILADYKQAKVEYAWTIRGKINKIALVSNIVPIGIESTAGGGTIRVDVFDAEALPLAGAEVRFVNNTTTTTIDTLRYTDLTGVAYLSGAPAAANYEITATDVGYSTDGTYTATTSNPNPTTKPITVTASQISSMNFQIDKLSDLLIKTVGPATYGTFTDTFTDSSLLSISASTTVTAGDIVLTNTAGLYDLSGSVQSTSTVPAALESWYAASFVASTTASTSVNVSLLYNNSGIMALVPDGDLPGNSSGFTASPIDISSLNTTSYPELALSATLMSTDSSETPELHQWNITHITAQPAVSGVGLAIEGSKSIGVSGATPVLKYTDTGVSDGSGEWEQDDIEWDTYMVDVTSPGYSIYEVCSPSPYILEPDVSKEMTITLAAASAHLLRVTVSEIDGTPIPNATVHLTNAGVDELSTTSLCGQTYFNSSSLYDDDDYLLIVSASGFTTETIASTTVSSSSAVNVILN